MFDYSEKVWDMCEKHMSEKIKTKGTYDDNNGVLYINPTEIYSFLIKEAAKCTSFASDIIYNFEETNKALSDGEHKNIIVFGFREMGVDGAQFVYEILDRKDPELKSLYILFLDKICEEATLYEVDLKALYKDAKKERLVNMYNELTSLIASSPSSEDCTDKENEVYNDMSVLRDSLYDILLYLEEE